MQGLILAAGMGKRLKELTQHNTKCMVEVNGVTLIERVLCQLDALHLSRIVIVVGYKGKKLIDFIGTLGIQTPICFVENLMFDKTNNIYSLALAKEYLLQEDTLLLESDLIFEDDVLKVLLDDPRETLALVDKYESWMDGTCVKIGEDDSIDTFVSGKKLVFEEIPQYYKTVNIYKFSRHFSETYYVPFLDAYSKALGDNEYYEQVLRVITMLDDSEIRAKKLNGQLWYEIDDIQDLDIASSMFAPDSDEKVANIQARYGGYWRYPNLLDFCYLVNPFFPPQKLMDEMKASFEKLLTQYPSGMRINSLLAAKNFGVHQENILVGNGAAELIKSFMGQVVGKVGIVRPTFEEYPSRCKEDIIVFEPANEAYAYTAEDVEGFFADRNIANLIIVNPDNPSGNYIMKSEMLQLIQWTKEKEINLLVDESFVDFSDELDASIMDMAILEANPHLYVMKSISKSYGVPGLRLGVLASGNTDMITRMKGDVAIWNINSFAEFYMQIAEKYEKDYIAGLSLFRAERKRFQNELQKIKGIKVFPSQANYVMVEITGGKSAKELTKVMLLKYNLFVKDLSAKLGGKPYLRIAVRDAADNNKLLSALKNEFGERVD